MTESITVRMPIKTVSEANSKLNWRASMKRHKSQKNATVAFLWPKLAIIRLPCHIKMTRIAPRALDAEDNLPMAFKWIKDAICDMIKPGLKPGRADDDKRFSFEYAQRREGVKEYAIEIEITNL